MIHDNTDESFELREQDSKYPIKEQKVSRKGNFWNDVLILVGGTFVSQTIIVLSAPVLSRMFSPEAFGTSAIFTSIVTIISVISCLRYDMAIMLPSEKSEAANLLVLSFFLAITTTFLSSIVLIFFGRQITTALRSPELFHHLYLIPITIFLAGFFFALNSWDSREQKYQRLSVARINRSIFGNGYQLASGFIGKVSAQGLIVGTFIGQLTSTGILSWQIWSEDRRSIFQSVHFADAMSALKRYAKFPLVDVSSTLINNLSWQLPVILLALYFDQKTTGFYALSYRLIQLPMSLIGGSISQVFYQRTSSQKNNPELLSNTVLSVIRSLVAVGLFPALLMIIVGQDLFSLVFGKTWIEAGIYVQILGAWFFVWIVSSPLSALFSVLERQEDLLIINILILISRIVSLVVGGLYHNVFLALGLFSGTGIVVYGAIIAWSMHKTQIKLGILITNLMPYVIYSIPGLLLLFIKIWLPANTWLLVISTCGFIVLYYVLVIRREPGLLAFFSQKHVETE